MRILNDLNKLLERGIIDKETAHRIQEYYKNRAPSNTNSNRLFAAFSILGALLVGLGIILIIAHNWDNFSKNIKVVFAFIPLVIGQLICGYVLWKQYQSKAWREGSTVFLFFAVGACISLISQIYNISGNLNAFILTWMLLCFPLIFVMNSSMASLFYLIGITYYGTNANYFSYPRVESYWYWALLIVTILHYYRLYREAKHSNFMIFHNWFIPISLVFTLGTVAHNQEDWMFLAYMMMFSVFYLFGGLTFFDNQRLVSNGYKVIGSLGMNILLLTLSFNWFWEDLIDNKSPISEIVIAPEFITSIILFALASTLLYFKMKGKPLTEFQPSQYVFIAFTFTFLIGLASPIVVVLINIFLLGIGILIIREGAIKNHLGILNYGMLIISTLVACRFFDVDLSFVLRGILFLLLGAGFFGLNYWMLQKRKSNG